MNSLTITNLQTKQQYTIPEDLGKLLSDNGIKESEYFYAHLQHIFSVDKPNGSWFVFQSGEPDAESFWLDPNKFTVSLSNISKERVREVLLEEFNSGVYGDSMFDRWKFACRLASKFGLDLEQERSDKFNPFKTPTEVKNPN